MIRTHKPYTRTPHIRVFMLFSELQFHHSLCRAAYGCNMRLTVHSALARRCCYLKIHRNLFTYERFVFDASARIFLLFWNVPLEPFAYTHCTHTPNVPSVKCVYAHRAFEVHVCCMFFFLNFNFIFRA